MRTTSAISAAFLAILAQASAAGAAGYFTRIIATGTSTMTGTDYVQMGPTNWARADVAQLKLMSDSQAHSRLVVSVTAQVHDTYTLNGPNPGAVVPIVYTVDADYQITHVGYFRSTITVGITTPTGGFIASSYRQEELQCCPFSATGDPNAVISLPLEVTVGQPFNLGASLQGDCIMGGQIQADHTATIGFQVPPGYSITSELGWPGAVPAKPSTWSGVKALF